MAYRFGQRQADVLTWSFVIVFAYGTAVHVVQLTVGNTSTYPEAPPVVRWFFVALVVLDPVAATLLLLRRRAGLIVGNCVLILDAAANAAVSYPPLNAAPGITTERVGQGVVTLLALILLISTPGLWRRYSPSAAQLHE